MNDFLKFMMESGQLELEEKYGSLLKEYYSYINDEFPVELNDLPIEYKISYLENVLDEIKKLRKIY